MQTRERMLTRIVRRLTLAAVAAGFAVSSAAQPVRVPGTKVTLAPPDGFSIAQQYPGFEGTGHLLQIEKPDECIRLTLEFLGKHGLA